MTGCAYKNMNPGETLGLTSEDNPRTDVARGLAIVEGVGGQLFLAVMVARLVSLFGRGEPSKRS